MTYSTTLMINSCLITSLLLIHAYLNCSNCLSINLCQGWANYGPRAACGHRRTQNHGRTQRGLRCHASPWPCNKVLKPNFQCIISQANNGCSLLLLILAKPQLLDISCGNIFAVSIVTALTACPFSIKK